MAKAVWNDVTLAESDDTVVVEGNHYFPPDSIVGRYFEDSETRTVCSWKGEARYYHLNVDGRRNEDAAWYYPEPKPAAKQLAKRVAFWRGVRVVG